MKKIEKKVILQAPISVSFEVGRTVKQIYELMEMKKGTVIKLDSSMKNEIVVYANEKKIGTGKAVRKDGEMYVKMTDILHE